MAVTSLTIIFHSLTPHFSFPEGGGAAEFIILRWLHLVFGIIWIGLLYFFNLVGFPTMKQLDASTRGKVYPVMMSRAMAWFRWSAMITIVVGVRYYFHLLIVDVRHLQLRLGRLWHVGEESAEILVLDLGLLHRGRAALGVPRIRHRQFGARDKFRIRIGVDQRLQRHPRHIKAVVLHGIHRPVEQHLIGLF